ncbi:MAG: bifunctional tetrahydrofolate synthase/dihydrofolate synthase [Buchnera aphidicola (Floraphis meitanensis)]
MHNNVVKSFSFVEWLDYIKKFGLSIRCSNFKNVIYIAKKLGILKLDAFIYMVGGTNGKGTTCVVLENIFLKLGYRVGLYTSPHLFNYTERVRINGFELEEYLHVLSFSNVENARNSLPLTYYDFITLSALYLFRHSQLDIVILEVGLGGRLDATNVINPNVSIVTNIQMDHIETLGNDRNLIGIEKIGIFRKNKIAIISEKNIPNIVKHIIYKNNIDIKLINRDWNYKRFKNIWAFISTNCCFLNLPLPKVSLINTATALAAVTESQFSINKKVIEYCIDKVSLLGRCQIFSDNPKVILDVAHNNHATKYLSKKLMNMKGSGKIYAIVGILKGKNILGIVSPLISIVDFWYCSKLKTNRSVFAEEIVQYLPIHCSKVVISVEQAWIEIRSLVTVKDIIVIFGSFFTVKEIYKILNA